MSAVEISEFGAPEMLQPTSRPLPEVAPGEVLIKVAAAGVNRPDCLQRRGLYPPPEGASDLPGLEVAGIVAAVGANVDQFGIGDPVCALLAGGGYAEYATAPWQQVLPAPAGVSLAEAAAIPETFFTVWTNVFELGQLQAGEKLLVHGGASGIGSTAIQLGKALGATVYATAGDAAKCSFCEELGAARAVNYRDEDFLEVLKPLTGKGVDVVLDIVGGSHLEQNVKLLAPHGRLVTIGILGGAKGTLNLGLVLSKKLTLTGSTLRARPPAAKGEIAQALLEQAWPLLAAATVRPAIQKQLPLDAAAEAHQILEDNAVLGKLVLIVNDELAAQVPGS